MILELNNKECEILYSILHEQVPYPRKIQQDYILGRIHDKLSWELEKNKHVQYKTIKVKGSPDVLKAKNK